MAKPDRWHSRGNGHRPSGAPRPCWGHSLRPLCPPAWGGRWAKGSQVAEEPPHRGESPTARGRGCPPPLCHESWPRGDPQPGLGNPWGGAAESALPPAPSPGTLATSHQPVCSPCFGKGPCNSRGWGPAPVPARPTLLSSRVCPHGTDLSPGHLTMGSKSNPSAGMGTLGTCVTVAASPNQPTPAWGSLTSTMSWSGTAGGNGGRGWGLRDPGVTWWQGMGDSRGAGRYSRWRRRVGGRRRSRRRRGGCCSASAETSRG